MIREIYIFQASTTDLLRGRARGCAAELSQEKPHFTGRFTKITEYDGEGRVSINDSGL